MEMGRRSADVVGHPRAFFGESEPTPRPTVPLHLNAEEGKEAASRRPRMVLSFHPPHTLSLSLPAALSRVLDQRRCAQIRMASPSLLADALVCGKQDYSLVEIKV